MIFAIHALRLAVLRTFAGMILGFGALAGLAVTVPAAAQESVPQAMLVVDGSGSMAGRVESTRKINIVKKAVEDFGYLWPDDVNVGLIVYGHRRKKDCSDIELVASPSEGFNMSEISTRLKRIRPLGNTPLTAAIEAAAEAMSINGKQNSIILVSDGKENCERNPCEVARKLKEKNVDLTAYVVGLGLKDKSEREQLQCVARETGGLYWDATRAEDVQSALDDINTTIENGGPLNSYVDVSALGYSCRGEEVVLQAGAYSFADEVRIVSAPVRATEDTNASRPTSILGAPDYAGVGYADGSFYSMGCNAEIEVSFVDNALIEGPGPELCLTEVGIDAEPIEVLLETAKGWESLGFGNQSRATVDFARLLPEGAVVDRIRLRDAGACDGPYPGADIDSVIGLNGAARRIQY